MTRRRDRSGFRRTAGAVVLLLVAVLAGCGDAEDSYCEALATERETLTELAGEESGDVLTPTLTSFEKLRSEAPDELRDEWDVVLQAYRALADAVDEAGVDPATYDPDEPPPGVTAAQAGRLADAATSLQSSRVLDAGRGIEDHARSVCDVDFAA
jgi:hypothetical protein